jgi:hypothetical protein
MADPLALAANNLLEWLQTSLRKSNACSDDPEEDQYVDPCQFLMDNYPDARSQAELSVAFQDVLKSCGDIGLPITTVGNPLQTHPVSQMCDSQQ